MDLASGKAQHPPAVLDQQVLPGSISCEIGFVFAVVLPAIHLNGQSLLRKGDVQAKPPARNGVLEFRLGAGQPR